MNTEYVRFLPVLIQTLPTLSPETPHRLLLEALHKLPVEALRTMSVGALPALEVFRRNP